MRKHYKKIQIMLSSNFLINSPLEQFEIVDFVYILAPIFGFTKLSLTNIGFYLILVFILIIGMNLLATNNRRVVANRWSVAQESTYGSILNMVREQIGPANEIYVPFIFVLFNFILFNNLVGMIPYSFTPTSHLVLTLSLGSIIVIAVTILGFQRHGLGFFALFIPAGTPLGLVPLLVFIETISYLARMVSLGLRLGANMIAGHTLLKILSTFAWKAVLGGPVLLLISVLPVVLITALAGLELGIAILQAYVFTILTCSYLKDAIDLH
jgi:F-type H+-transporting ATPase subunit a